LYGQRAVAVSEARKGVVVKFALEVAFVLLALIEAVNLSVVHMEAINRVPDQA
jgi:hypothetical protein